MIYYTIQPGDTLYSVAAFYGIPITALLAVNPGLVAGNIYPGLVILIPVQHFRPVPPPFLPYPIYPHYPRPPVFPGPGHGGHDHGGGGPGHGGGPGPGHGGPGGHGHGSMYGHGR